MIYTWYIYDMIDTCPDTWFFNTDGFLYSLDYALPIIVILVTCWMLFYQTMLSFNFYLFHCIIYWYYSRFTPDMHVHYSLILHTLGVSNSLNLHIQVYVCYFADQVFGKDHTQYFRSQSFVYLILQFRCLFFLILIDSVILCILDSTFIPFGLFIEYYVMSRNLYVIL